MASNLEGCHIRSDAALPVNDFSYLDIEGRSLELMLERNRGVTSTTADRRQVLLDAGLPPDDLYPSDWTLFVNVARVTEWGLIPAPLGFYRLHNGQDTRTGGAALAWGIVDGKRRVWAAERSYRLEDYGVEYTFEVQWFILGHLKARQWRQAWSLIRFAVGLLPR